MRRLFLIALLGAGAYAARERLVDLLTKSTGTWVGTPDR